MNEFKRELINELKDNLKVHNRDKHITQLRGVIIYLLDNHFNSIVKWFDETINGGDNYGILFYLAGFDGKKQNELQEFFIEEFGVYVF